jgi:hypothetical protein
MEMVYQWTSGICLAAAAVGLCYFITPKSGLGRVFRMLLSLFFLCTVLSPLREFPLHFPNRLLQRAQERAEQISQQTQTRSRQAACEVVREQIETELRNFLAEEGITPVQISIDIVQQEGSDQVFLTLLLDCQDREKEGWLRGCLESERLELRIQYQEGEVQHEPEPEFPSDRGGDSIDLPSEG